MKKLTAILLGICLMFTATSAFAADAIDNSETRIGMMIEDYENGNFIEIMFIQYDGMQAVFEEFGWKNPTIQMIEHAIRSEPLQIWNLFNGGELEIEAESIEIRSYPFHYQDYVQIVITCVVQPETRPDLYTKIWSYNYRLEDNVYVTVSDMMDELSLTDDEFFRLFTEKVGDDSLVSVEATGFLASGDTVDFLLEVVTENEYGMFKDFYMYSPNLDTFEWLSPADMFGEVVSLPLWLLTADTEGMEEAGENEYLMDDGMLFVQLQSFAAQSYELYDEETLAERITLLEGDIRDIEVTLSEEYSALLTYPAWLVSYTKGYNEDMAYCLDLYFQTDWSEYRAHTRVCADSDEDYEDVVKALFESLSLEEAVYSYLDMENMLELYFPAAFSPYYEYHESGAVVFHNGYPFSGSSFPMLVYEVLTDVESQQASYVRLDTDYGFNEVEDPGDGTLIAWGEVYDAETDESTYVAYLWVMDSEEYFAFVDAQMYPAIAVVCETEEEAAYWYGQLLVGDIYIISADGLDMGEDFDEIDGVSEDYAMELLTDALWYRLEEGLTLVSFGVSDMNDIPCWSFALGEDSLKKFTALEYFVVTFDGEIYVLNISTDEYEPFAFG